MTQLDSTIKNVLNEKSDSVPAIAPEKEPGSAILFWTLAIVAVLIIGIFVISYFSDSDQKRPRGEIVEYNNWEFEYYDNLWWTLWQRDDIQYILSLRYNPIQTLEVTVDGEISETFERDTIHVSFDPTVQNQTYVALAAAELSLNLARAMGVEVIPSCTVADHPDCENRPIVNCDTENVSVIIIRETKGPAGVLLQGDCMTLYGEELELVRAVDRMVYTFYGIIRSLDP